MVAYYSFFCHIKIQYVTKNSNSMLVCYSEFNLCKQNKSHLPIRKDLIRKIVRQKCCLLVSHFAHLGRVLKRYVVKIIKMPEIL